MTETPNQVPGTEDGGAALLDWLATMRDEQPVWQDRFGVWHVFRHADVLRVVTEHTVFSSDQSRAMPEAAAYAKGNITMMDPPEHRKLRQLVSQAFSARTVDLLADRIREVSVQLADSFAGGGTVDLVQDFAYPLPVIVICELLGIPGEDRPLFRQWADTLHMAGVDDLTSPEFVAAFQDAVTQTTGYFMEHCKDRRANPRGDLLSQLVAAEVDGERLADYEIVNFAGLLLMTGHVTTTVSLGNTFMCLRENPDALAEIRADRTLVPAAVEEAMRHRSPFMYVKRVATHEVELGGVTVPPDQLITPWLVSANRDERAFPEPERFDIHRSPNAHLGLGRGVHFCLGAQLTRLEARIALNVLFDRYTDLPVEVPSPMPAYGLDMFGTRSLPTELPPAFAAAA